MAMVFSGLTIPPAASLNAAGRGAAERQLPAAASRSVVPLVYGRERLAGLILNVLPAAVGSSTLLVQVLWCFACDGFEDVRWNDQPLPVGASVTHYIGTQTTADAALVTAMAAQSITYAATLAGFAYSVFSIPTRTFDGQLSFTATIRGERLYDPRQDSTAGGSGAQRLANPATWTWSDNPALALADLLRDTQYGAGRTVNWASVIAAANHCDALIGTPAERRRIVGVSFTSPNELDQAVDTLRAYSGCFLLPSSAGVTLLPDQDGAPVASYSHAAGDIAALEPLMLRDQSALPTVVEVIYTDTAKIPWRDGSATAALPGAGSTRPYRLQQVRLPGVQRYSQALREATERLNKLTLGDMTTIIEVFDIGLRHEVGDIISVTHPVGITNKPFRVAAPPEMAGPGRWRLPLVEHDPAMYSTAVVAGPSIPDTSFLSPAGPPPDVVVGAGGVTVSLVPGAVRIAIPPRPVVDIEALEIRRGASWAAGVRLEDGIAGSTSADGTVYDWAWPAVGSYTLWLRWRDRDGITSVNAVSTSVTVTSATLGIPYADVAGRPNTLRVVARGGSSTYGMLAGLYQGESGALVYGRSRSHMMLRISRATGAATFSQTYDVFGNGATQSGRNAASLAADLNATGADSIVIVYTEDEPAANRLASGLDAAMYRCGASRAVYGSPQFQTRAAYVLIGIGGCGEGQGFEAYQGAVANDANAWVDVAFQLIAGNLIVTGSGATPRTLADYSYVGDLDATRGAPAGTLVAGTDAATLVTQAATAAAQAAAATTAIAAITADNVLSQPEKPGEIIRYNAAVAERPRLDSLAQARGVGAERTVYTNAYNALVAYMATLTSPVLWSDMSGTTTIVGTTYRSTWDAYYTAQVALLQRLSAAQATDENLVWNGKGLSTEGWTTNGTGAFTAVADGSFWPASYGSAHLFQQFCREAFFGPFQPVRPGETYFLSFDSLPAGGGTMNFQVALGLRLLNAAGAEFFPLVVTRAAAVIGFQSLSATYVIPDGVTRVQPFLQVNKTTGDTSTGAGNGINYTNVIVRRMTGTSMLEQNAATDVALVSVSTVSNSLTAGSTPIIRKWVVARSQYTNPTARTVEVEFTADTGMVTGGSGTVRPVFYTGLSATPNTEDLIDQLGSWAIVNATLTRIAWARQVTLAPGQTATAEVWMVIPAVNTTTSAQALDTNIRRVGIKV